MKNTTEFLRKIEARIQEYEDFDVALTMVNLMASSKVIESVGLKALILKRDGNQICYYKFLPISLWEELTELEWGDEFCAIKLLEGLEKAEENGGELYE